MLIKNFYFFYLLIFSSFLSETRPKHPNKEDYVLQSFWQKHFLEKIKTEKNSRSLQEDKVLAWGLFSYGGWGDDGQIFVLKKNSSLSFYTADSGGTFLKKEMDLSKFMHNTKVPESDQTLWQDWQEKITRLTKNLTDLETKAFDGIEYQYVFVSKKGEQKPKIKRIYMNNPQITRSKNHKELIKLFHTMREKYSREKKQSSEEKLQEK